MLQTIMCFVLHLFVQIRISHVHIVCVYIMYARTLLYSESITHEDTDKTEKEKTNICYARQE